MDCKQFTYIIEYFKFHSGKLDLFWQDGNPADEDLEILIPMTEKIQADLDKVCDPASLFIDQFEDDQWRLLFETVGSPDVLGNDQTNYMIFERLLGSKIPALFIRADQDVRPALDMIRTLLKEKIDSIYCDEEWRFVRRESGQELLYQNLCTVFLNSVLKQRPLLDLRDCSPKLINNCEGLNKGVVLVDSVLEKGGEWSNCIIIAEDGGNELGLNKLSGVIIAKKAQGKVGQMYQTIKEPIRSTILVEDSSVINPLECKTRLYSLRNVDAKKWSLGASYYVELAGMNAMDEILPTLNSIELNAFKEVKCGLIVIDKKSLESLPESEITEGFEDGIIVLRALPSKELGKGMTGGVIIIETNNTLEEIQAVLSDEYIPGRGIILRRVPDRKNRGETKLEVIYQKSVKS